MSKKKSRFLFLKIVGMVITLLYVGRCSWVNYPYIQAQKVFRADEPGRHKKALEYMPIPTYVWAIGSIGIPNVFGGLGERLSDEIRESYKVETKAMLLEKYKNTRIAYYDSADSGLYTMAFDGSDKKMLTDEVTDIQIIRWSNDGEYLIFSDFFNIYYIDTDGTNFKILINSRDSIEHFDISPDSTKVIYINDWGALFSFNLITGENKDILTLARKSGVAWLANSSDIFILSNGKLYTSNEDEGILIPFEINLKGLKLGNKFIDMILSRDGNRIFLRAKDPIFINLLDKTVIKGPLLTNFTLSPDSKFLIDTSNMWNTFIITPVNIEERVENIPINVNASNPTWSPWLE